MYFLLDLIEVQILVLKIPGCQIFYSVKLDVNEIKREIYFWNQQPSYINALHSDSIPNYIAGRKSIVGRRGLFAWLWKMERVLRWALSGHSPRIRRQASVLSANFISGLTQRF